MGYIFNLVVWVARAAARERQPRVETTPMDNQEAGLRERLGVSGELSAIDHDKREDLGVSRPHVIAVTDIVRVRL